jgi:asparagine synthase (glutamine-hydrolysing)
LGAHEIYLNSQARALSPVRLTGVFGGEILRGVSMFKPLHLSPRLVNADLSGALTSCARQWSHDGQHPVTFAAFREIPEKRFGIPAASRSQVTFRTPYLDNEIVALAYQAPKSFRTSLLPALSLIKNNSPRLSQIPTDMGQVGRADRLSAAVGRVVSKITCKLDYFYSEGFPHGLSPIERLLDRVDYGAKLFGRHKFLQYRKWFKRELAGYLNDAVTDLNTRRASFWNAHFIKQMASEHTAGRANYVREIDAVLTLEAIERLLFRDLPRGSGSLRECPTTSGHRP